MKYLVMICRGHVPTVCRGNPYDRINKDIKPFLLYFPKGLALNWHTRGVEPGFRSLAYADHFDYDFAKPMKVFRKG
jgi:hypothetical protein